MFWQLKDVTYITLEITIFIVIFTPLWCIVSHKFKIYTHLILCLKHNYLMPEEGQ